MVPVVEIVPVRVVEMVPVLVVEMVPLLVNPVVEIVKIKSIEQRALFKIFMVFSWC
jgi:hypothetical protein